jgi:acyl carrier protein
MQITRQQVETDTLTLLQQLADDWEYSGEIDAQTYLLADMGLESLGVVILSATVQEFYETTLPFTDFFTEIGNRKVRDVTVGEWVDFVFTHLRNGSDPGR